MSFLMTQKRVTRKIFHWIKTMLLQVIMNKNQMMAYQPKARSKVWTLELKILAFLAVKIKEISTKKLLDLKKLQMSELVKLSQESDR